MALVGQAVSEKKIFEIVDGRTDDGRTPDHSHPISSPCEPNGSGELKISVYKVTKGDITFNCFTWIDPSNICTCKLEFSKKISQNQIIEKGVARKNIADMNIYISTFVSVFDIKTFI